ncbi:unnamed protein product [Brassica rapa]|uniref:TF-B3 domain-containing protein n=1 Tax=Brassica campestris TaxID=3711 RepID=A0A3P5Z415_BRACM|nr:unnamed protein product [Brassica rapa]VDC70415.1 unnamed protein product [Brassica rapa]
MNQDTQKLTLELFPLTPNVVMNVVPISDKIDLARMRLLSNEEREEEQQYGVSTELNLFTDPWTIKKELTITDISYLNHLLLNTSTIHHHVLRYLPECDRKIVQEGWPLAVDVYDHDTDSTHQMLLRKRSKCLYYVLTGGWFVDFVCRRALKIEDEIGMFWDRFDSTLHFSVLSREPASIEPIDAPVDTLLPDT